MPRWRRYLATMLLYAAVMAVGGRDPEATSRQEIIGDGPEVAFDVALDRSLAAKGENDRYDGGEFSLPPPWSHAGVLKGQSEQRRKPQRPISGSSNDIRHGGKFGKASKAGKSYKNYGGKNYGAKKRPKNKNKNKNKNPKKGQTKGQKKGEKRPGPNKNCLQQNNRYRTCLKRNGKGFVFDEIVHDCQKPYLARNEGIISGTMHLSLLQDNTRINSNTERQIEELTLSYLADNIGGKEFEPVCVQVTNNSYDRQVVPSNRIPNKKPGKKPGKKPNGKSNRRPNKKLRRRPNKPNQKPDRKLRKRPNRKPNSKPNNKPNAGTGRREFVESNVLQLKVFYVKKLGRMGQQRNLEDQQGEEDEGCKRRRKLERHTISELPEDDTKSSTESVLQSRKEIVESSNREERELQFNSRCTPLARAQCCSQNAINGKPGQYCRSLGCDIRNCGPGRRKPRPNRFSRNFSKRDENEDEDERRDTTHLQHHMKQHQEMTPSSPLSGLERRLYVPPFTLYNRDFNVAVRRHTQFQPDESEAHLDVDNTRSVAICSANRYSLEMFDTPTLDCDDFVFVQKCQKNDDLVPALTPKNGGCIKEGGGGGGGGGGSDNIFPPMDIPMPTLFPTVNPTINPTIEPTLVPTIAPTIHPTAVPTIEPTVAPTAFIPTINPTIEPTTLPTSLPTDFPTTNPTISPTILPTGLPTTNPTISPTVMPTMLPTGFPTVLPCVEEDDKCKEDYDCCDDYFCIGGKCSLPCGQEDDKCRKDSDCCRQYTCNAKGRCSVSD